MRGAHILFKPGAYAFDVVFVELQQALACSKALATVRKNSAAAIRGSLSLVERQLKQTGVTNRCAE